MTAACSSGSRRLKLSASREAENAISKWNIGHVNKWAVAEEGEVNRNFILTTEKGKYVLRQVLSHSHYENSKDLEFELDYLNYLRKSHFPYHTPSAISTRTGKLFANIRGHNYWVYKFIRGKVIGRLGESHFGQLARMIGTYHHFVERSGLNNGKPSVDPYGRVSTLREIEGCRRKILRKHRTDRKDAIFMTESARLIPLLRSLDERPFSSLKRYPIHRDIIPENLILARYQAGRAHRLRARQRNKRADNQRHRSGDSVHLQRQEGQASTGPQTCQAIPAILQKMAFRIRW